MVTIRDFSSSGFSNLLKGEIIHLTDFGKHMIILNSPKAVSDLLDHKSSIYSSRPQLTMLHEL